MAMRIDRLLCYLRFVKSRKIAHDLVERGLIRCNGERVLRASHPVGEGSVLTFPLGSSVRVIELVALPQRRGPANEARECYRDLDPRGEGAIAAQSLRAEPNENEGNTPP